CNNGYLYLPYPSDCNKFIQCGDGEEFVMKCPPNLYWDYQNYYCGEDKSVCYNSIPSEKPEENPCSGGEPYVAHATDCTKFIQCSHGRPFEKQCPENLFWNPRLNVCGWSDEYCT
ncbi:hypothetical protein KR018_003967, partial [Drosophila ironensis]